MRVLDGIEVNVIAQAAPIAFLPDAMLPDAYGGQ